MKKKLLILVVFIATSLFSPGCAMLSKLFHKTDGGTDEANVEMVARTYEYSAFQLDSMCVADKLPRDLDDGWLKKAYSDYETSEFINRYMYIKVLKEDSELIYIVTPRGEMYLVTKREVITVE